MSWDVVLVSDARNNLLRNITINAIRSAGGQTNVIVVESNKNVGYEHAKVIYPNVPFNYNRYLNIGANEGNGDYIFFGNNDLIFTAGWATELSNAMNEFQVDSASPVCPYIHSFYDINIHSGVYEGNNLFTRFCGWAFAWRRTLYEQVGGLDESFSFWCSDNCTIEQLIRLEKNHILVTSSIVHHLARGRNTLRFSNAVIKKAYTILETKKFNKLFGKDWRVDLTPLYKL